MATLLWTPSNSYSLNLNLNRKQSPLKLNANPSLHFNPRFRFNTTISCNSTNHNNDTKPKSQPETIQIYSQIERLVTTSARQSQDAWGSADWTEVEDVKYVNRSRRLQEEVRGMINDENMEILELIDVKRLGLSYHFEKEIKEALDRFLLLEEYHDAFIGKSLHDTALKFKVLREFGYDVSADVFERFKDNTGNFKACLVKDVQGMLSLYEASFMSYEGENILDEANSFTSFHLRGVHGNISNFLFEQVSHSLELPLHRRFQRLEARWFIVLYGKRKDANKVLLEAAKLDFNIVQSNLQQDLIEMSSTFHK
ncbi:tricyclene synthase TPS4, chloroplastic-like isoform X2 [Vicia villosa]|uniref:tricyclene synthase TPS4, chloroplastic-like isoform X2 n=1 Tax=Vicia villosa TaxID=3911 RepID=UPI00273AC8AD|nr:tricyclene synthase TPS4, chloroplastic-like isoform X2 [Vicia villosa]XP_058762111.1 tricyclene synthase TPS4, chloroplastic-like isoform X2 [Vicia villosa]XP_058762112.1 tricyclene synthase TPS4, chloroplastic-like isoform X2 [Vicia villosa]